MVIGFADMISTAVWHANGQIEEMNPLLKPIIEQSEWLFVAVKAATLIAAYVAMAMYARKKPEFVRNASRMGILVYLSIYLIWFVGAMLRG